MAPVLYDVPTKMVIFITSTAGRCACMRFSPYFTPFPQAKCVENAVTCIFRPTWRMAATSWSLEYSQSTTFWQAAGRLVSTTSAAVSISSSTTPNAYTSLFSFNVPAHSHPAI